MHSKVHNNIFVNIVVKFTSNNVTIASLLSLSSGIWIAVKFTSNNVTIAFAFSSVYGLL